MSNTFNHVRFGKLFRKHSIENYKSYLMSAGVLCGSMILFYSFLLAMGDRIPLGLQTATFAIFYLAGGAIFTSNIFSDYGKPRESIIALTLPASHFEKFLIAWLYSFLVFTFIFMLLFYAINIPFVNASKAFAGQEKEILNVFKEENYYILFFYTVIHAFVIYGAIFFKKLHFIKTACLFFILLLILTVFHTQLMKSLIPGNIYVQQPFGGVQIIDPVKMFFIRLDEDVARYYYYFLFMALSLTLWAGAYFQLKEKQI